jgi:hypothetical protein
MRAPRARRFTAVRLVASGGVVVRPTAAERVVLARRPVGVCVFGPAATPRAEATRGKTGDWVRSNFDESA